MNHSEFEHPPLGRILKGFSNAAGLSPSDIRASLKDKGYNPEAVVGRLKKRAASLSREARKVSPR